MFSDAGKPARPARGTLWALALLLCLPGSRSVVARSYAYVQPGTPLSYCPGSSPPAGDWTALGFTPGSAWIDSQAGFGIGYGDGDDVTVLTDMQGSYLTVYVRSTFTVGAEISALSHLALSVRYDDGFVAYLNGTEVGRANLPSGAVGPDTAASGHEVTDGDALISLDPALLVSGQNVLAVEVHNASMGSSDLSLIPTLWGYDVPPPDAEITLGPFLQQVGRRTALVVWETDQAAPSEVAYGLSADALVETAVGASDAVHHEVEIPGLLPGQALYFQVVSAHMPSPMGQIWPETDAAEPFRFVLYGDTRSDHTAHGEVVALMLDQAPAFTVNTGDLVADGADESAWAWFFAVEAPLLRSVPLYPTLGNHEGSGDRYMELFSVPDDSPGGERYYAFHYATVGIAVLDLYGSDFGPGSDQATWLESTLAGWQDDPQVHLRIVALHHGPYDSGSHGSNLSVRSDLVPLFEAQGVDLVVSGHDHDYERSTVNGVKYVVTGGGGAPLYGVSGDWWTEVSESVHHALLVEVEGPRATVTAYRTDGTVLDQFDLGEDGTECSAPSAATDCASRTPGTCLSDEDGAWSCVHGTCIWSCTASAPITPDAGLSDASVSDAGASPDGSGLDDAGPVADAGGPGESEAGCGCQSTRAPVFEFELPFVLAILGWVLWTAKRRPLALR